MLLRTRAFPPVPLEVLTGSQNYEGAPNDAEVWRSLHAELAALSPQGRQSLVECGHDVPFSRPDAVMTQSCALWKAIEDRLPPQMAGKT